MKYIDQELEKAVPEGWEYRRSKEEALLWLIEKRDLGPDEWPMQDYQLFMCPYLHHMLVTFGNNDLGGEIFSVQKFQTGMGSPGLITSSR